MPEFYRDDMNKPINIEVPVIEIKPAKEIDINPPSPEEYSGGYFFRYLNSKKNSRLLSEFKPGKIWEIKWQAALDSSLFPWFLLLADNRVIVQNESGWQMFDTDGKFIAASSRTDGNVSVDIKSKIFYQNEFSGFLTANNLESGEPEFLVYPYFGKGYDRNIVWYNENKFLSIGYEIPAMTHKSSPKEPDITLFETMDVRDKSMIDSDKILNSAHQIKKLILKSVNVKTAVSDGITVAASDNFISVIDQNLEVKKLFRGEFIPVEISLDDQLNIFLIIKRFIETDDSYKYSMIVVNQNGELISETELPFKDRLIEFYPPVLGYDLNTFILAGNRLISIDSSGKIKWDNLLADSSPGVSASSNGYLLTSEGNLITAFNSPGERSFIFQFESEKLFTHPLLTPQNEIYVATQNFLYCLKIKDN